MLIERCECPETTIGCKCLFGVQELRLERLWSTTSLAEAKDICTELGISIADMPLPEPEDINTKGVGHDFLGTRHPYYPGFVWSVGKSKEDDGKAKWRWVFTPGKGN